jgi:Uma2 family endonuclease
MITKSIAKAAHPSGFVRLPDPPEPEDMNNYNFLHFPGNTHHLAMHLGNLDTTIMIGDAYISREPTSYRKGLFHPDMLIAFNVNPAASQDRNGYVISEQGNPPDFVMEIASPSTGRWDVTLKRAGYAALGIPEYWRFDDSGGRHHGAPLAGDRLEGGVYRPILIERIDDQIHQGYSAVLNLHLRWEQGRLGWYDPDTGRHIPTFSDERERADRAEARVRELEAELRRRGQQP